MSSTNQYQPLLPDIPVLVVLDLQHSEADLVQEILEHRWQLFLDQSKSQDHPDLHWLNPEESLKIETVRELQSQVGYKPYSAEVSCYVLSHLETASQPAQQALLKILEEPPGHVRLILTAASNANLLPTILSRCQILQLKSESQADGQEIEAWYHQVMSLPLGKLVELADEVSEKPEAQTQAQTLIYFLHHQLQDHLDSSRRTHLLKQLQITQDFLEWLNQNLNLKLAVTEWLLRLKKA